MGFGSDHPSSGKTNTIVTKKLLPVIVGHNYQHVMARASIEQTAETRSPTTNQLLEPARAVITIVVEGGDAQRLGDFVAADEIVALSFDGVPVRPILKKEK